MGPLSTPSLWLIDESGSVRYRYGGVALESADAALMRVEVAACPGAIWMSSLLGHSLRADSLPGATSWLGRFIGTGRYYPRSLMSRNGREVVSLADAGYVRGVANLSRRTCNRSSLVRLLVPAVMVALVAASCGEGEAGNVGRTSGPYVSAAEGLCRAAAHASEDTDAARREFYDAVHQPLHELAVEIAEVDRTLAARLLAAKESVEIDLDNDQASLVASLSELIAAMDASLDEAGHAQPQCLATAGQ